MQQPVCPRISVLVPTHGRGDALRRLLDGLAQQTLPPEEFEVVVVDDGSPVPFRCEPDDFPYAQTVLTQPQAGPGAARNLGLEHCRAPLVLILNDDAIPASDLLERHLEAHERVPERTVVLGTFRFGPEARRSPFVRLLDESDLLFTFSGLRPGELHDWRYFWTCNLSLPVSAIPRAGGFDTERFPEALVEDVELGYRLHQRGWRIYHAEDCRCWHEHSFTPEAFFSRAQRLGIYLSRMYDKHGAPEILWCEEAAGVQVLRELGLDRVESQREALGALQFALEQMEEQYFDQPVPESTIEQAAGHMKTLGYAAFLAGMHQELTGVDPRAVALEGAPPGELTSVIVVSCDQLEYTRRCVEDLRAANSGQHPIELIVVDNGSSDGSAQWLAEQEDLILIENAENLGAPHARNQAIGIARGAWLAFLDSDVFVPEGWLEHALYHGAVDPRVGAIALVANRASKHQQVPYAGTSERDSIQAHADLRFRDYARHGVCSDLFTSLGVLVRREVIERIGGFDERFSPWGFEDDDLALRVRFAGWRIRVAMDTFVYHAPYPDQAKHQRHSAHLHTNWERFAAKWGQPGPVPPLFDYQALGLSHEMEVTEEQLVFALPIPDANEPWPLATEAEHRLLAWPRYGDEGDLEHLLATWAGCLASCESTCLCLRHDEALDGPMADAVERLQAAWDAVVPPTVELEVLLVDGPMGPEDLLRLGQAVEALIDIPGCDDPARAAFAHLVARPQLESPLAV